MGMSIDKSLEWLISRKEHYEMDDNCQELAQALDTAISVMGKYQHIQAIVEAWKADVDIDSCDSMGDIREVVEDGSENNHNASNT